MNAKELLLDTLRDLDLARGELENEYDRACRERLIAAAQRIRSELPTLTEPGEPGRLEIAARMATGLCAYGGVHGLNCIEFAEFALRLADALIATARKLEGGAQ